MEFTQEKLLYVFVAMFVLYLVVDFNKYVYKKSSIDGQIYKVKNNEKAQQSADALSMINIRILKLIAYIKSLDNQPEYSSRLDYYNPSSIKENIWDIDTTYTVNKGQEITFCLAPRDNNPGNDEIYPINLLMYVAIHELAHVVSISTGHNEEFKKNFNSLLGHAVNAQVYKRIDFNKTPAEYCGIYIDS